MISITDNQRFYITTILFIVTILAVVMMYFMCQETRDVCIERPPKNNNSVISCLPLQVELPLEQPKQYPQE